MMLLTTLTLTLLPAVQDAPAAQATAAAPAPGTATVDWRAPENWVRGKPFPVEVDVHAGAIGDRIPGGWMQPEGFTVNGETIGSTGNGIQAGFPVDWTLKFDLGPFLSADAEFTLGLEGSDRTQKIAVWDPAPAKTDFETLPVENLADWYVVLRTNRGDMVAQFWPDVAPNHVRNFLDLSYTGFYDGILFHRCIPGFVIQAGDPQTKDPTIDPRRYGTGNGPRKLDAEFNDRPHDRGVLSMARLGGDVNSATSQFFICQARVPSLDRQYTAFGKLISGLDVLDKIMSAPKAIDQTGTDPRSGQPIRRPSDRPVEPQRIEHAYVVRHVEKQKD